MKHILSFNVWMKTLGFLLILTLAAYITFIMFEYYWPQEEDAIVEFKVKVQEQDKSESEIINFETASPQELEEAGFIEPTEQEQKMIKTVA